MTPFKYTVVFIILGICSTSFQCLSAETRDGRPLKQAGVSESGEVISDHVNETYLRLSPSERALLDEARQAGLIEIAPVVLPEGSNVVDDNDHFGWPVAAMVGDAIVVHASRKLSHYRKDPLHTENASSRPFIVRSTDGGRTWGPIVDVKNLNEPGGNAALRARGPNAGGMLSIGATRQGDIVMKHNCYPTGGLLVSKDGGATWA